MASRLSSPAIAGFLDRNYRYRSVATQYPHDDELAPILQTGRKILHLGLTSVAFLWYEFTAVWHKPPDHGAGIGKHFM